MSNLLLGSYCFITLQQKLFKLVKNKGHIPYTPKKSDFALLNTMPIPNIYREMKWNLEVYDVEH